MTGAAITTRRWTARAAVWLLVGGGLLLVAAANWQLVTVALRSQPDCVAHLPPGDSKTVPGRFSAAESSCSQAEGPQR
jgi:hypothetical protein